MAKWLIVINSVNNTKQYYVEEVEEGQKERQMWVWRQITGREMGERCALYVTYISDLYKNISPGEYYKALLGLS